MKVHSVLNYNQSIFLLNPRCACIVLFLISFQKSMLLNSIHFKSRRWLKSERDIFRIS